MIVLLLGPPECGKSTQADLIFSRLGLPTVDVSELLARAAEEVRIIIAAVSFDVGSLAVQQGLRRVQPQGRIAPPDAIGAYLVDGTQIADLIVEHSSAKESCVDGFCLESYPATLGQAEALEEALARAGTRVGAAIFLDVGDDAWTDAAIPVLDFYRARGQLYQLDGRPFIEDVEEQVMQTVSSAAGGLGPRPGVGAVPGDALPEAAAAPAGAADKPAAPTPKPSSPPPPSSPYGGCTEGLENRTGVEPEVAAVRWIDPRMRGVSGSFGTKMSHIPVTEFSVQYRSSHRLLEDKKRNDRPKHDPSIKYKTPATAAQEIGWSVRAPENYKKDPELYHPRMKSRETMYAEALILGPRHP